MTRQEIVEKLQNGVCEIIFTKVNGDERIMSCTLMPGYMRPVVQLPEWVAPNVEQTSEADKIVVWDVERQGLRSFRVENVQSVRMLLVE